MPRAVQVIGRVVAAAGLAYDAYVHFDLAATFDGNVAMISQGMLFRIEAVLAAIAALLVLLVRGRLVAAFALLVAGGGLAAVLLYSYVDLGPLGPLPNMYEPIWYPEKTLSAVAEAAAFLAAAVLLLSRTAVQRRSSVPLARD